MFCRDPGGAVMEDNRSDQQATKRTYRFSTFIGQFNPSLT
jgi:hypothetical protein